MLLDLSLVAGLSLPSAALSICYEYASELSFPVHESVSSALMVMCSSVVALAFYLAIVHLVSLTALLWALPLLTCMLATVPLLCVRDRYARLALDHHNDTGDGDGDGDGERMGVDHERVGGDGSRIEIDNDRIELDRSPVELEHSLTLRPHRITRPSKFLHKEIDKEEDSDRISSQALLTSYETNIVLSED